jgi:hypothetical protein
VRLVDGVSLIFEGTNLLRDTNRVRLEPIDQPLDYVDPGRRILLGIRGAF